MMQMILVAAFLIAITTMACGPSATTSESDSGTSTQQPEASDPALLLSEESAISILQAYLQECVLGWDSAYEGQITEARAHHSRARSFSRSMGTVFPTSTPLSPVDYQLPPSEQQKKSWLIDLASKTTGDIVWSASHHGIAGVPNMYSRIGTAIETETWVVIGPGLERAGSESAALGRWQVYAGHQRAYYLDAPARLALEEYDSYDSCP